MWRPALPKGAAPIYKAIADALQKDVSSGALREGTRLPTHRELAGILGITTLTATRGYAEAARRGLIESAVGRGTFVRSPAEAASEGERKPLDLSRNAITGNESLDLDRRLLGELTRVLRVARYESPAGSMRHRHVAAQWIARAHVHTRAERVVVTVGAHHAILSAIHAVAARGGTILSEALTYPGLRNIASFLQMNIEPLPIDDEGLRPRAFDKACRETGAKVLYTLPNFQNPTGSVMPDERRKEIASIARKHGVTIIEDDVYGLFMTTRVSPLASILPEQTCYITGASKTLAPSLRLGFISAPETLVPGIENSIAMTTIFASTVAAEVFASLVESGEGDRLVTRKREVIRVHQRLVRSVFGDFMRETHHASPHAWIHLPANVRTPDVVAQAEARGISVAPASAFAVSNDIPNAIRIAVAAADSPASMEPALRTLAQIMEGARPSGSPLV